MLIDGIEILNMIINLSNKDRPFVIKRSEYHEGYCVIAVGKYSYLVPIFNQVYLIEAYASIRGQIAEEEKWYKQ